MYTDQQLCNARLFSRNGTYRRNAFSVWEQVVRPGDAVVDATCVGSSAEDLPGLCSLVGPDGHVYVFGEVWLG